jgi:hypothetical protein
LKVPPYISLLCIVVGVAWLFMLPLDEHSRRTYISENALLPGQVHTYFGGSDQNVLRAYRHEVSALENSTNPEYVASRHVTFVVLDGVTWARRQLFFPSLWQPAKCFLAKLTR